MKLNINDVLSQPKSAPIWVLNKTSGSIRGPIMFEAPKLNGSGVDTVRIPDTWLPVNLTEQLDRAQITAATEFRRIIRVGQIAVIDAEEAEELKARPGANEEDQRVREQSNRFAGHAAELLGGDGSGPVNISNPEEADVSPKIVSIMERIEDSGEIAVINSLRSISSDLSDSERAYIQKMAAKGNYTKLESAITRGSLSV